MKRVGITGGGGFIGTYVQKELVKRGYVPVIMDRRKDNKHEAEVYLGDVTDETSMREFAAHVDGVIHLAAVLGTQETIHHPIPAVQSNLLGGLNFLEAISQYDIPAAYIAVGNWWMNNPYSISKNMIERFCSMYNNYRGARVNIVRALNAYGPGQSIAYPFGYSKVRKITPSFICRALSSMPIEVYGDGTQISDMVHVSDVARALVSALEYADKGVILDRPVEVGPEEHTMVKDTALEVIKAATEIGYNPVELNFLPMRPGEVPGAKVIADSETLKLVGINPDSLIPFHDGIRETVKWFHDSKGKLWEVPRAENTVGL